MKQKFSFLLTFSLLLYLSNFQLIGFQSEGRRLLEEGKIEFSKGEFGSAIKILNNALNIDLSVSEKIEAHLYIGICWIALNEVDKGKKHFKEIIKINPEYIFNKGDFPSEIKDIFDKTKYQFPIIYDFSLLPEVFYPYKGNKPYFNFQITSPDCVDFNMTRNYRNILMDRKCFDRSGFQIFEWNWKDELINADEVDVKLIPNKNKKEYSFERKIKINVELPKKLFYRAGSFRIKGLKFLPENKIKRTYPNLLLWSGLSILSGIGAYHFFTTEPEKKIYYYSNEEKEKREYIIVGVTCSIFSIFALIKALTPRKQKVTIKKNIDKNNQLKKKIQNLKEKIKVKQKIK